MKCASITAEKALELRVIDLIAADTPDLLKRLNGRVDVDGKALEYRRGRDRGDQDVPIRARLLSSALAA